MIKRLLRPVMVRVDQRVDHRIRLETRHRLDGVRAEVDAARATISSIEHLLPELLNIVASQKAAARAHERALTDHERTLEDLGERVRRVEASVARSGAPAGPQPESADTR